MCEIKTNKEGVDFFGWINRYVFEYSDFLTLLCLGR